MRTTNRMLAAVALVVAALAVASCGGGVPARTPDITGVIRQVTDHDGGLTVLVSGASDIDRISADVDAKTVLLRQTADGGVETATMGEVTPGRQASLWIDGPLAESYPPQGRAGTLLLLPR